MCGFAGFLTTDPGRLGDLEAVSTRMALAIQHRGPDDAGAWADELHHVCVPNTNRARFVRNIW